MAKSKGEQHGKKYPVNWLAAEFGIDRMRFSRRIDELGIDKSDGITLKQAHDALTIRQDIDRERLLRQKADREASQAVAAEKTGRWAKELRQELSDAALGIRNVINGRQDLNDSQKRSICAELADYWKARRQ